MISTETIQRYVNQLTSKYDKISLQDFMSAVAKQFYPDQDLSFMEYFLELTAEENDGQFIVPHEKLIEYGIATSGRSANIKSRLESLGLIENEEYLLLDVQQQLPSGAKHSKRYHLTPEAFKLSLMRALRRTDQPIDVTIYAKYYLFLEKSVAYYSKYQRSMDQQLLKTKDDKIDKLTEQVAELLGYAKDTKETLDDVRDDLTETKETVEIAKSFLAEKSLASTMNPSDESKHHFFGATKSIDEGGSIVVKFVTGQKAYVDAKIKATIDQEHHEIALPPFYNANGIDLRQNVLAEFNKRREAILMKINTERKQQADEANQKLREEITSHNRANPDQRRTLQAEKSGYRRIGKRDVTVTFKKLSFKYKANAYMSFDEVVQIILDVNGVTQSSPLP